MKIRTWRIFEAKHAESAFTGKGAQRFGGRWNSPGTPIIDTAENASLAILELLVHLSSHQLLEAYHLCEVTFDEQLVETISRSDLPPNWQSDPVPEELQQIGDAWVADQSSAVLCVPSAVVDTELNYLLNPAHPDFAKIEIGPAKPFRFDSRLIK